jgi:hypothetical protein
MLGLELSEQIAAAHQKAAVDEMFDIAKRHGGLGCPAEVNLRDSPWKKADCEWFERNPKRAHRMRMLFPGEADEEAAKTPAGYALVVLVRQVAPGLRPRVLFCLDDDLLPLPDDEAVAHALFEVAVGREAVPADRQALCTLLKKYTVRSQGDA